MSQQRKLQRVGINAGLGIFLLLLASFPVTYPQLSALLRPEATAETTAVDPSSQQNVPLAPSILMDYANIALQSLEAHNYTAAQLALRYADDLPSNTAYTIRTYLDQISLLTSDMRSLSQGLGQLQDYVNSGRVDLALQNATRIEALLNQAANRLGLLSSALDRIEAIYAVNVSRQRTYLIGLEETLQVFRQRLDALVTQLQALDGRLATQILIQISPNPALINGTLNLQGQLRQTSGTELGGRVVVLWVNTSRIAAVNVDVQGMFSWSYSIPRNSHPHILEIYASFQPTGQDLLIFRPVRSSIMDINVSYFPVTLTAAATTDRVHILERFDVTGKLTDSKSNPISNETVWLLVDDIAVNSSRTDTFGNYSFESYLPVNATEGDHFLSVQYSPTRGNYGTAQSQKIILALYYLNPTLKLNEHLNSTLGFSGQTLTLSGNSTIEGAPFTDGIILILEGQRPLGSGKLNPDGSFKLNIVIPIEASGATTLTLMLTPTIPWALGKVTSLMITVLNSAIFGSAFCVLAVAAVTLSRGSGTVNIRRRQSASSVVEILTPRVTEIQTVATMHLVRLRRIRDPRVCVEEAYWETRRLISLTLHESGPMSETPREFASRFTSAHTRALSELTPQFEYAEYSLRKIEQSAADNAINLTIMVAEELGVNVEHVENWDEFVERNRKKAAEILRRFNVFYTGMTIHAQTIVEIPWYTDPEIRFQINTSLEKALNMPAGTILVRFCDMCDFKLVGKQTEKQTCTHCGRKLKEGQS